MPIWGFVIFLLLVILSCSTIRLLKNELLLNWPKYVIEFIVLVATIQASFLLFTFETYRAKNEETNLFKRNYMVMTTEAINNIAELNIFGAFIKTNMCLPPSKPYLSYEVSLRILENPLSFKYSGFTLQLSFSKYKELIEMFKSTLDSLYSNFDKSDGVLDFSQTQMLLPTIEAQMQQMIIFKIICYTYAVGYNATQTGPEPTNNKLLAKWITGENTPSIDSLNLIMKGLMNLSTTESKLINNYVKRLIKDL